MSERYEPSSEFLKAIIAEEVPLSGSELAQVNLERLVAMTRDGDRTNRDWATMLLAQEEVDTQQVREALLEAAQDEDEYVRGEALVGLARRDRDLAMPMVREALLQDAACYQVFEASAIIAHPSLVDPLRMWTEPSDNELIDSAVFEALRACEAGCEG